MKNPKPLLVILGPTASGKTALAQALPASRPLQLISADSQQVYRGMDIGTAKPAQDQRSAWALVDVVDPGQSFSAGDFCRLAKPAIEDAWSRGALPVVVGGTGLYIKALLEGLADIPAVPAEIRLTLEAEHQSKGLGPMLERLDQVDPALAAQVDRQNPRRVLRALEVFEATGKPLSQWQSQSTVPAVVPSSLLQLGLDPGKELLDRQIESRTDACLAAGWLKEVLGLKASWGQEILRNSAAIGYPELLAHAQGQLGTAEARQQIIQRTRQYSRRQRTWFKAQSGIVWGQAPGDPGLNGALNAFLLENP